jgi:hypothetical protein
MIAQCRTSRDELCVSLHEFRGPRPLTIRVFLESQHGLTPQSQMGLVGRLEPAPHLVGAPGEVSHGR